MGYIFALIAAIFLSSCSTYQTQTNDSQNIAKRLEAFYSNMRAPAGDDKTENSSYMVLNSLHAVYISYDVSRGNIPGLFQTPPDLNGKKRFVLSNELPKEWVLDNLSIPVDGLMTSIASVVKVLKNYGVDEPLAYEFAFRIQKETVEALGAKWEEYEKFFLPHLEKFGIVRGQILSDARLLRGMRQLAQIIDLSQDYDIPYLAGYSDKNSKMIYMDRELNDKVLDRKGDLHSAVDFLIVHEVVEKLLMDELTYRDDIYVHTHQYAQRAERECVLASGISWEEYQGRDMEREIKRAEDPKRVYKQTPADLDLTPYLEYKDTEAINAIKKYAKEVPRAEIKGMKLSMIRPGIYHVYFDSGIDMAKTLLRFQEYYESPKFRGQYFSLDQYKSWYTKLNGKFDYYESWGGEDGNGFNLPSTVLKPFYEGKFKNLSAQEKDFLSLFQYKMRAPFYIVVTASNSQDEIKHEMAHAFYYTNPQYKKDVQSVLQKYDLKPLKDFLMKKYEYSSFVVDDEAQAWIMKDLDYLKKDKFDVAPYEQASQELRKVYSKHFQPYEAEVIGR